MILSLGYDEVQRYAAERSGQEIGLKYVDENTCEVSVGVKIPVINKVFPVSATIKVERIQGADLFLGCSGGSAFDMAFDVALPMLQKKIGADLIEKSGDNQIVVHLDKNEKIAEFLQKVQPTAVQFSDNSVIIHATLL